MIFFSVIGIYTVTSVFSALDFPTMGRLPMSNDLNRFTINKTAVPFRGHTSLISSSLSPKRDRGAKRGNLRYFRIYLVEREPSENNV